MEGIVIRSMNDGLKIDYEIMGNKIIFADELMLNLAKYERDDPMHIDICKNEYGCLCMGLASSYVAQIDIPAREYEYVEDGVDEQGNTSYQKVAKPFDMNKVEITLWEVEE